MISRAIAIFITLATIAAVPALRAADTQAASKSPLPTTGAASPPANANQRLITVDFPGGTVAELVTAIGVDSKAQVFVLNRDGIGNIGASVDTTTVIPPFSVRNATPENFARAFNEAMAPSGLHLATNGSAFLLRMTRLADQSSDTASASAMTAKPRTPPINIDFPGGSVAQLVALINSSESGIFNLIGEKTYQEAPLPSFSLRNAEPASLALALNGLLRPRELAISLAGPNIFVLAKSFSQPSPFASAAPTFQAFQLAPYLTTLSIEDITDAILVAWESAPDHDPKLLRFKYHPATKLLFVYGPPEAIAIATQLVPQLDPAATTRARLESYRSSAKSALPVPNPTVQEEAGRLNAVTQEVLHRREARETTKAALPPLENK